jgi:hypothetical protein
MVAPGPSTREVQMETPLPPDVHVVTTTETLTSAARRESGRASIT